MLNRKQAPAFQQIQDIQFIKPTNHSLRNGIPVYIINAGDQELVRIEFIFKQVNWDSLKPLSAIAANGLISAGTTTRSAHDIASQIDYYGAFLQTEYASDHTIITLYSLTKHLGAVLPIIWDILNNSEFPEQEIAVYKQNQKQSLQVNLQKNDFVARRTFANALFDNTSYGTLIDAEDYNNLKREDILAYYKAAIQAANCTIIIAGKFEAVDFDVFDEIIGNNWSNKSEFKINAFSFNSFPREIYIEKPDSIQSAIRLGTLSITRKHPDFPSLQILNTVLGGYFGSRLMANIREDKGFTYGIGSGIASLKNAGYFFLATEVGVDVCQAALVEIEKEINLLKSEMISNAELDLVKNYMLGSLLGSLENAFSHADKFKNLLFSGLGYDYYENYIKTIKQCNGADLLEIANKYLNWDQMTKVIVGKK